MPDKSKVSFRLLFITDRKLSRQKLTNIVEEVYRTGVKAVQLREKDLPASELLKIARDIKKIAGRSLLLINDRLDIGLLSKANGVHSPEKGLSPHQILKFDPSLIAGKSVHSLHQAKIAEKSGFDYILFGPVFRTPAKVKYGSPLGLEELRKICLAVNIPVFAVGGISPDRVKKCLASGAYGVAVIRAIMRSHNITKIVNEFKTELGSL